MDDDTRFDGIFMNVVQQSQGIDNFFNNLFGFMRRKTDLYTFPDKARGTVSTSLEKHIILFNQDKSKQDAIRAKKESEQAKKDADLRARAEQALKKKAQEEEDGAQIEEVTEEEAARIEAEEAAKKSGTTVEPVVEKEEKKEDEKKEESKGQAPNAANGGQTDKYQWEQTLNEVTVNIEIPAGTTSKMLVVDMTQKRLKVGLKGQPLMIDGEWSKPIKVDDSLWCIENAKGKRILELSLTKKEGQNWWNSVIKGDEEIDTQKVEPENSKLGDLDGETRGVVEKMMFDQQQKQKGLPTSEESEKKNKLKAFMDAHPEMDFSKAKFS